MTKKTTINAPIKQQLDGTQLSGASDQKVVYKKIFQQPTSLPTIPFPSIVAVDLDATTENSLHFGVTYKIAALGATDSGKQAFMNRIISNNLRFIGIDFFPYHDVNGRHYRVWDTAGQERFRTVLRHYISNAYFALFFKQDINVQDIFSGESKRFFRVSYNNGAIQLAAINSNESIHVTADCNVQAAIANQTFNALLNQLHQQRLELQQNQTAQHTPRP